MSPRRLLASVALAFTALAGTACSDVTGLDENDVEGVYEAVQFDVVGSGFSQDVIAEGGWMVIVLNPDGTTEGEIYAPGAGDFGEDFYADLTGDWDLRGDRVYVETFEDTFLNDAPLEIQSRGRLTMDRTFSSGRVILDLRRESF